MKLYIIFGTFAFVVASSEDEAVNVARNYGFDDHHIEIAIREDISYEDEYGWCGSSSFKWDGWMWRYVSTHRSKCTEHRTEAFIIFD